MALANQIAGLLERGWGLGRSMIEQAGTHGIMATAGKTARRGMGAMFGTQNAGPRTAWASIQENLDRQADQLAYNRGLPNMRLSRAVRMSAAGDVRNLQAWWDGKSIIERGVTASRSGMMMRNTYSPTNLNHQMLRRGAVYGAAGLTALNIGRSLIQRHRRRY